MFHNNMSVLSFPKALTSKGGNLPPGQLAFRGLRTERTPDSSFTRKTKPRCPPLSAERDPLTAPVSSPRPRPCPAPCFSLRRIRNQTHPPDISIFPAGGRPPSSHMSCLRRASPARVLQCSAEARSKGRAPACGPVPPMERDVHAFSTGGFQMPQKQTQAPRRQFSRREGTSSKNSSHPLQGRRGPRSADARGSQTYG